ncbi:prepilin peptidase [Aquincola sp. S2]|uniref:Prepilin leader peptidase/N-methyltransferase n=1 Tax=Pseudaquabacterium terrae TaxID=2732868 RepID=A0ABX2ETC0_9BURK|nr:A24 family peptidase [Aquabacterium terrae]NRF71911.1 prepilin peptidase [Aquabacterium terrae]
MYGVVLEGLLSPVALGVLGLVIGSFLNVVIHRKPVLLEREWLGDAAQYLQDGAAMQRVLGPNKKRLDELAGVGQALEGELQQLPPLSLSRPRSRCPQCGRPVAWHENIPLLGWLRLGGKCAGCKSAISARYPIVELLTGVLFAAVAWRFGPTVTTAVYCVAVAVLVAAAFIDLDTTLLPDDLTLPLVGLGLVAAWQQWTAVSLPNAALGALFGYFALWFVARTYKLLRGVEGMAEGDFKLLAGLGALLGWQTLPSIILLSSVVGAAVGIFMIVARGHGRSVPIPFGPYLAGGGVAAMFFGAQLSSLWQVG